MNPIDPINPIVCCFCFQNLWAKTAIDIQGNPILTSCGHLYHDKCSMLLVNNNFNCAQCNRQMLPLERNPILGEDTEHAVPVFDKFLGQLVIKFANQVGPAGQDLILYNARLLVFDLDDNIGNAHDADTNCPICLEGMNINSNDQVVTSCGHRYHERCLRTSIDALGRNCPLCRTVIRRRSMNGIGPSLMPIHDVIAHHLYLRTFSGQVIHVARARIVVYGNNQLLRMFDFNNTLQLELVIVT